MTACDVLLGPKQFCPTAPHVPSHPQYVDSQATSLFSPFDTYMRIQKSSRSSNRKSKIKDVRSGHVVQLTRRDQRTALQTALDHEFHGNLSAHTQMRLEALHETTRQRFDRVLHLEQEQLDDADQNSFNATNEHIFSIDSIESPEFHPVNSDGLPPDDVEELTSLLDNLSSANTRTSRDNLLAEATNWRLSRGMLIRAYRNSGQVAWSHVCDKFCRGLRAKVTCVGLSSFEVKTFSYCKSRTLCQQLIYHGFFPCSPRRPSIAFSIDLLRHFQAVQEHGKCSKEAYANGTLLFHEQTSLKELVGTKMRHHFSEYFHDAHAHWLTIDAASHEECYEGLNVTHRALVQNNTQGARYNSSLFKTGALHEMCPACFGWSEPELNPDNNGKGPALIFCLDGNMQHKRYKRAQETELLDTHPNFTFVHADWTKLPNFDPASLRQRRNATDIQGCERHFHAAEEKVNTNPLIDSPGLVLASCRHGSQIRLFDMLPGLGERRIYATLLANELATSNPAAQILVMYDIACQFDSYARRMAPETLQNARFTIPALHGYAHQFQCQVLYHCRLGIGYGLSDGENVERNWSEMDRLVPPLRTSTSTRRLHALCNFVRSAARRKRVSFAHTIESRWKNAEKLQSSTRHKLELLRMSDQESQSMDLASYMGELRHDLADRENFYRNTSSIGSRYALEPEPIDILFQLLSVQTVEETLRFDSVVHLPYSPSLNPSRAQPHILEYGDLWQRWQKMDELTDPGRTKIMQEILQANNWLRDMIKTDRDLFETAMARHLSCQVVALRRLIWTKWSDNMQRTKRLRGSKTGERGSTLILRSMLRANHALRTLIDEHNTVIEKHIRELPRHPSHEKLELSLLSKDVERPGFLLMPATVMQHRWMKADSRSSSMEHMSRMDRASEELSLLKAEVSRLFVFYEARCATLFSALCAIEGVPENLLRQITFLETRAFRSIVQVVRSIPALSELVNITSATAVLKSLTLKLASVATTGTQDSSRLSRLSDEESLAETEVHNDDIWEDVTDFFDIPNEAEES